jgi:hypothetical protein
MDELEYYRSPIANVEVLVRQSLTSIERYDIFDFMTLDECIIEWNKKIPITNVAIDDGIANYYVFNETDVIEFAEAVNKIGLDRILGDMVKKGLLDVYHNGTDFCFGIPKAV